MAIGKNYFIYNYYRLKLKYSDSETCLKILEMPKKPKPLLKTIKNA